MTRTIERIKEMNQVKFKGDKLFEMFGDALKHTDPLADHLGRHFTGTLKGWDKGLKEFTSNSPALWEDTWKKLGVETPPMALPADTAFSFIALGRKSHDTVLELKNATRSLKGIQMDWDYACVHRHGAASSEEAQYHITIIPDVNVKNVTNRLNVTANGTILRSPNPV